MEKKNVYVRAREVVRELRPVVHTIREYRRLDAVCAITWSLGRRP